MAVSGEWAIAIMRALGGTLALAVTVLRGHSGPAVSVVLGCEGAYLALAVALLVSTQLRPQRLPWRQDLAMLLDASGIALALHFGGAETSFLYLAYLWMIIGNGSRLGLTSAVVASALSAAGFAAVVAATPFWQALPRLMVGLLAALLVLPSYTSLLIAHLKNARRRAANVGTEQADAVSVPFDLSRLLAEVQGMIAAQARAEGLRLNGFITARTPLRLRGDARHLRQVLLSLCGDAIRFTGQGSVTIAADGAPAPGGAAIRLRFEVADTRIGVAPGARERVVDASTQADAAMPSRCGSGLCPAAIEQLVRLMGGEIGIDGGPVAGSTTWMSIDVASDAGAAAEDAPVSGVTVVAANPARAEVLARRAERVGVGAEITPGIEALSGDPPCIVLVDTSDGDPVAAIERVPGKHAVIGVQPREPGTLLERTLRERAATLVQENGPTGEWHNAFRIAAAQLPARGADAGAADAAPAPMRVLVANGNRLNRMVMAKLTERAGHTAVLASHGEEALEILVEEGADIALLDVTMPVLDGIETAQSYGFVSLPAERRVPLIGVTADASPAASQRYLDAGMAACLVRPVRFEALLRALGQFVGGQGPAAAPPSSAAHEVPTVQPAPVDQQVLVELTALGGRAFLADIVCSFVADTECIVATLEEAAIAGDAVRFRAAARALCSSAADAGAVALQALCEPWQHVALSAFVDTGPELAERLRREWQRTRAALHAAAATRASTLPSPGSSPGLTGLGAAAQDHGAATVLGTSRSPGP